MVNNLHEPFPSAYRVNHSTDTAMLRVQNDIIRALGDNKVVLLVLIDLSAAFDTVNHERSQQLECGLPQGSVLGPILFNIYTAALGLLLRQEETNYSMYADDTDLYLIFKPSELTENVAEMERTAGLVRRWMAANELKMNDAKTEVMLITPRRMAMRIECPTLGAVVGVGRRIRLDEDSSSGLASLRTSELLLRIAGVRRNEAPRRNESPYSLRGHRRTAHA